ncbi:cysteine-rich receptor-like protein kinase 29 isoform X2 [Mercurialis annua]|nr:cysteine-rich receptor-like protein kinase 29 isoform X2 [Mercurialis annua]
MNNVGNYTANSTYQKNLNTLLSTLISNTQITYGFYNLSVGQIPDQANAIALCKGDVSIQECRGCIRNSTRQIIEHCPNYKEVLGFYDSCMLRFSNRSIFGLMETQPTVHMVNEENVTDANQFDSALQKLLSRLRSKAASGNFTRKFATGNESAGFETIYGLVQCTPDISEQNCNDCMVAAIRDIPFCCDGKLGGRVMKPSCNFRYENYRFYQPMADAEELPPPPQPLTPTQTVPLSLPAKGNNRRRNIIIIIVLSVSVVSLVICTVIFLKVLKTRRRIETVEEIISVESLLIDFETIKISTDNFSEEKKLGEGGFGSVYKGTLPKGEDIAVKRLSNESRQGDIEFKNEVLLVAKLQHRNLARLLGFCLQGIERLLIYEFVPNASLDRFIFDPVRCVELNWEMRYKIIVGIARGLLYLHEDSRLRIIHRDLKASNILLDEDMNPKISDFGMARLFIMDQTHSNTSRIVGTFGYMAPEYAMHGQFSVKSDVFSFGVLILEIVSGVRNSCFCNEENVEDLLSFAWRHWRNGTSSNLVDRNLKTGSMAEIMKCIHIGLLCVQENIGERPTMASVVLMLSSHSHTLPVPARPAFFMHGSTELASFTSSYANQR